MVRDFAPEDRETFIRMATAFYHSEAVDHPVPPENFDRTFQVLMEKSPFARGLILTGADAPAGYALLALTHSNEAGGLCVWIEELYVEPFCRGQGIGQHFFDWLKAAYPQAARFRLELSPTNTRAAALYRKMGFVPLDYRQMVLDRT